MFRMLLFYKGLEANIIAKNVIVWYNTCQIWDKVQFYIILGLSVDLKQ